jgi:hypothetical protein
MASVWMMSFDWDGFNEYLARPAAELAGRLARRIRQEKVPYSTGSSELPRAKSELVPFLQKLIEAEDWYAGKSPREARTIDGFVDYLFHHERPLKPLGLKPLSDGVISEVLEIATGRGELDDDRNSPRERQLIIRRARPTPEDDASELSALGSRPFRHPSWDRKAAEELSRLRNPFIHGADAAYFPDYSIHSPEQVCLLRQNLVRVGDKVRRELDRVKSKRVRIDAIANFEEDLARPVEDAAGAGRAVFARWDY